MLYVTIHQILDPTYINDYLLLLYIQNQYGGRGYADHCNTKGYVYALNAKTGDIIDEKKLNGKSSPSGSIIINYTVFVGSQDSNVYSFPLTDFDMASQNEELNAGSDEGSNITNYIIVGVLVVVLIILVVLMMKKRRRKR